MIAAMPKRQAATFTLMLIAIRGVIADALGSRRRNPQGVAWSAQYQQRVTGRSLEYRPTIGVLETSLMAPVAPGYPFAWSPLMARASGPGRSSRPIRFAGCRAKAVRIGVATLNGGPISVFVESVFDDSHESRLPCKAWHDLAGEQRR